MNSLIWIGVISWVSDFGSIESFRTFCSLTKLWTRMKEFQYVLFFVRSLSIDNIWKCAFMFACYMSGFLCAELTLRIVIMSVWLSVSSCYLKWNVSFMPSIQLKYYYLKWNAIFLDLTFLVWRVHVGKGNKIRRMSICSCILICLILNELFWNVTFVIACYTNSFSSLWSTTEEWCWPAKILFFVYKENSISSR